MLSYLVYIHHSPIEPHKGVNSSGGLPQSNMHMLINEQSRQFGSLCTFKPTHVQSKCLK